MLGSNPKSPRLAGWTGRRRSSRSDVLFDFSRLLNRAVAIRLGVVAAVAAVVTGLVVDNANPFPYRLGQTLPRDVRSRVAFVVLNEVETTHRAGHAEAAASPEADPATPPVVVPAVERYTAGFVVQRRDQPISREKLSLLYAEHKAHAAGLTAFQRWGRGVGLGLVVFLLAATVAVYCARFQPQIARNTPVVAGVGLLVVATLVLTFCLNRAPWFAGLVPLTVTAMVLTIAYNPPFALLLSLCLAVTASVNDASEARPLLTTMCGLATAVLTMRQVRSRSRPVEVGVLAGAAFALMSIAVGLVTEQRLRFVFADAGRNLLWGTLAGFIVAGCLPLVERAFGIVTDVTLQELADNSHPLLQELRLRAPGTYNHSLTVAMLAEAGAEAVGANPLLVRVGCYFHDVGKMLKPDFFVENQSGCNRHDQLEPSLSSLVIIAHVKDGVALAERYGLPRPVVDFVRQHHGTTLVEYFYREALRLHGDGRPPDDLEAGFRYPGPKPQTREAALLMLADAAESAGRAVPGPTASSLTRLVRELAMKRLLDGQFDECGLTLRELKLAEEVMCRCLIAVHHNRIRYDCSGPAIGKAA